MDRFPIFLCDEGEEWWNVYVIGEIWERGLCDEGYERCLCDGREGVPITNLPPPKRVFSPAPPSLENRKRVFISNLQTRWLSTVYLNYCESVHCYNLLIIRNLNKHISYILMYAYNTVIVYFVTYWQSDNRIEINTN